MKSTLNFYYNLFPDKIYNQEDFYYFTLADNKYYFVPFNNDEEIVKKIYNQLKVQKIKVNEIIFNKDGKIGTIIDNKTYALLMVNCLENEIVDLDEFLILKFDLPVSNWGNVWSDKLDYYAYQVSELALKKETLLNSFSYYVGLSENAITYFNMINKDNSQSFIQHRRIYAKNYEINYYNPLNMVIDFGIRDLAEYIKFSFFSNEFNIDKIINYINKVNLDNTLINLLYARLLFPTYYFDVYDKIIINKRPEKDLIKIVNKSTEYEEFLKQFYLYYSKKYTMYRIEWLFDK